MKLRGKFMRILMISITGMGLIILGIISSTLAASPIGSFDIVTNDGAAMGWALDPDSPNQPIYVHFYIDGPAGTGRYIGNALANLPRPDVNQTIGYPGDHEFNFQIPLQGMIGVGNTAM